MVKKRVSLPKMCIRDRYYYTLCATFFNIKFSVKVKILK